MPVKVPQRRVQPSALPGAEISAPSGTGAFGGLEAQALETIGGQVQQLGIAALERQERDIALQQKVDAKKEKIRLEHQERIDKLDADENVIKYQDWWRNQKQTYLSKAGKDTIGNTDLADKDIGTITKNLLDQSKNDRVRELTTAKIAKLRESGLNVIKAHEVEQFGVAEEARTNAILENTIRDAQDLANEPISLFSLKLDLEDAISDKTKGMDPEAKKNVTAELTSAFHESVINGKVAVNAENARKYYNENESEIVPENREKTKKLIEKEDVLQFSQEKRDEIMLREKDMSLWIGMAEDELEGEKEEKTVSLLKRKIEEIEQDKIDKQKEKLLTALDGIRRAPDRDAAQVYVDNLEDPKDAAEAQDAADKRFTIKKEAKVTDIDTYAQAWDEFNTGKLNSVRELNRYWAKLSDAHYNRLQTAIQNKIAGGDKPGSKVPFMNYSTAVKAFEASTKEKYDVTDSTQNTDFQFLFERLDEEAKKKGDTLDFFEARQVADKTLVEGGIFGGGTFSDPQQTRAQAEISGTLDKWLPNINTQSDDEGKERADIKKGLRTMGVITDDERIYRFYKKESILKEPLSKTHSEIYDRLLRQSGFIRPVTR